MTIIRLVLLIFLSVILASVTSAEAITGQQLSPEELNILLAKADKNFSRIKTVKTVLTQEKHISIFSEKVISKGLCIFKAPGKLRLEYTSPFKSALIINNERVHKYEYYENSWQKMKPGNKEIIIKIMKNITSWLMGEFNNPTLYEISAYKKENTSILLVPKNKEFKNFITSFELGLNKNIDGLDYIIINERKNDYTKIMFHNVIDNAEIPDLLFSGKETSPRKIESW